MRRSLVLVLLTSVTAFGAAAAQVRWTIDPKASIAWWQIDPHLNHLWATTCPQEPSWRPGEGRSAGWYIDQMLHASKTGFANTSDTINVPLYPRHKVRSVCTEAVHGQVTAEGGSGSWRGVHGQVNVQADALVTGENMRDAFTKKAVLETLRYPEIRFTLDSLSGTTQRGDTLRATAFGVFAVHGVTKPVTAAVRAWPDAGGMRVLAKFRVPAASLTTDFGMSKYALGLGVETRIWYDLFMGVDLLLRREGSGAGGGGTE
jgi:polyisoprenoid-binding protein YceI